MRIVVSGGGTAGHVSPVLATVDALRPLDKDLHLWYIGRRGGMEQGIVADTNLPFYGVMGGKIRRDPSVSLLQNLLSGNTLRNLRDLAYILIGTIQCVILLLRFRPQVVFNKVGPAGMPVGFAAAMLGIPMILNEPDIIPGWSNRLLSRFATSIATGFPVEQHKGLPQAKLVFTGMPVQEVVKRGKLERGRKASGFTEKLPVTLVVGGSQGAYNLNSAIMELLPDVVKKTQVYHVVGKYDYDRVAAFHNGLDDKLKKHYYPVAFLSPGEIGDAYALAEVVVARAGANTIAEIASIKKPMILVPNRESAAHQVSNATALESQGAAKVVGESPDEIKQTLLTLLESSKLRSALVKHAAKFQHPDGAKRLAELVLAAGSE